MNRDDWGVSLRCLSFDRDEGTLEMIARFGIRNEAVWTTRPFDVISRTLVSAEPLKTCALAMRMSTSAENLDFRVFNKWAWPSSKEHSGVKRFPNPAA